MPEKTVVLSLDDYCLSKLPFDNLLPLKEHYPNLKVTLFTIPYDNGLERRVTIDKLIEWAELTKSFDWIEIAVHGFAHIQEEFNVDKNEAEALIQGAENMFSSFTVTKPRKWIWFGPDWLKKRKERIELNIPHSKIFKAPRWQCSKEAYEVLRDHGYTVAVDRNQPVPDTKDLKKYIYNWSIEEPIPDAYKVIKGHGHIAAGMANDLDRCYGNLLNLPTDARFLFLSEYLKEYGPD